MMTREDDVPDILADESLIKSLIHSDACAGETVAIIHSRVDYSMIGSIISVAREHVDRVYVLLQGRDEKMAKAIERLGAEPVTLNRTMLASLLKADAIKDAGVVVSMFGDGSHDPSLIPELVKEIGNGYDVAIGVRGDNDRAIRLPPGYRKEYTEFMVCTGKCLKSIRADVLSLFNDGRDATMQVLDRVKESDFNVKFFDSNQAGNVLKKFRIGVVVPAYNEELLIDETVRGIPDYVSKIYVVNDCSKDRTSDVVNSVDDPRIVLIEHTKNQGVGGAITTGYKWAVADHMDIAVVMAGDNQMDPAYLPRLLMPIVEGWADYTKGNRLVDAGHRKGMSAWRTFGNYLLNSLNKIASGYWHVEDPQNGYCAITADALRRLDLDRLYKGYAFENDMLVRLNVHDAVVVNVPIPAKYGREKSKIRYGSFIVKTSAYFVGALLWRSWHKYLSRLHPIGVLYWAGTVLMIAGLFALLLPNFLILPVGALMFITAIAMEMIKDARAYSGIAENLKAIPTKERDIFFDHR